MMGRLCGIGDVCPCEKLSLGRSSPKGRCAGVVALGMKSDPTRARTEILILSEAQQMLSGAFRFADTSRLGRNRQESLY
jgi:hypothetical protein